MQGLITAPFIPAETPCEIIAADIDSPWNDDSTRWTRVRRLDTNAVIILPAFYVYALSLRQTQNLDRIESEGSWQ